MFPLLAQFAPLSPTAQLAIVSVLSVALTITLIYTALRRKPPLDVDLTKLASTADQLTQTVGELKDTLEQYAGHSARISALEKECATLRSELDREISAQRAYTAKTSREIFERIERVEQSVAQNFQSVERALGRVEGMLSPRT